MESDTFDRLDRQLVQALQLNARAPFSRIAEVLGVSDQTVARRYGRLRGAGRIRVLGLTEPAALGEVRWLLRVQCTPDAAGAVAEALARRPDTVWVSLSSGGTEINCVARAHAEQQDHTLLLQRLPRTASVVGMTAHCVIHTFFGGELSVVTKAGVLEPEQERALRPERSQSRERPERSERLQRPERSQREPASAVAVLDDGDRRLLDLLATDGRTPLAELATATGWSPSTVRRRMDELQTAGVLYFDLEVDGRIFDIRVETMLWLSVAPSELEATGQALAEHPEVAYAAATTGATNLYAVLLSRDVQAVYTYLTTRIAALPAVRQVETAPVMRNVKGPGPFWSPARGAGRG